MTQDAQAVVEKTCFLEGILAYSITPKANKALPYFDAVAMNSLVATLDS